MLSTVTTYVNDFLHLFFPHNCLGCNSDILEQNEVLCAECLQQLPDANILDKPGNAVEKIFYGRIPVAGAGSAFYYTRNSMLQQLVIQMKYKSNKEAGNFLGELLGRRLVNAGRFADVDVMLPVPLFDKRFQQRGYNQAEVICNGIQKHFDKPTVTDAVSRYSATETQTHKNRLNRWQTMDNVFVVNNKTPLQHKHILLVDDIVTTGATLEACANALLTVHDVKISIVTVAFTL